EPDGESQGQYGAGPGMVREAGRVRTAHDRNGCGAVGNRARVRGEPRRAEDNDLLGPRGARLEDAAPPVHETVRRDGPRVAEPRDVRGTGPPQGAPGPSRFPGNRGLRRPRGRSPR